MRSRGRARSGRTRLFLLALFAICHLPFAIPLEARADFAVTDAVVSVRLKAESRDDRNFEQILWGDRDILSEWRVRGNLSLLRDHWRVDLELQDQRIPTSNPALFLDASPMPTPASTTVDAGLRLAGRVRYRFANGSEAALGAFPVAAADGLLLGANEYGPGYRPLGLGWRSTGFGPAAATGPVTLVWGGLHRWNEIVGATIIALASHTRTVGPARIETGLLGRRTPSRPLYAGLQEMTATPYVSFVLPFAERFSLAGTGAYQAGKRHYLPRTSGLTPEAVFAEGHYPRKFSTYYTGDSGSRRVRAGFARATLDARLPVAWEPTITLGGSAGTGGGSNTVDRSYVGYVFDTNTYFGNAGYFGHRNARTLFTALAVPFRNGWSARIAVWKIEIPSPKEGLVLENGAAFAPWLFSPANRNGAGSRDALKEWDVEVRWRPQGRPYGLRLAYSEIRHGHYFEQARPAGLRAPPAQWAALQTEIVLD